MIAVLADEAALPPGALVWGRENRALPAAEREALTWVTLAALLGWDAEVRYPGDGPELGDEVRCAVVARDPASVSAAEATALAARLDRAPLFLVSPAPPPGSPLAELTGAVAAEKRIETAPIRWRGPGDEREWDTWPTVTLSTQGSGRCQAPFLTWALVGEAPLVLAREVGNGVVATLAAPAAELADAAPSGSGLLKALLTRGVPGAPEWRELEGWVIPRLAGPGSSSNAHLDGWAHPSLGELGWAALGRELAAREARISVAYVPGWVDDGDPERGELRVGGEPAERVPGAVHPSPLVTYATSAAPQDNPAGLRGIEALRSAGAAGVELCGFTHLRPLYGDGAGPYAAWAAAANRHESVGWYRELEGLEPPDGEPGPVARGAELLAEHLGEGAAALCCPARACSPAATEEAAAAGLDLVVAETLAIRTGGRLAWCEHLAAPDVDEAEAGWLESGFPVVACLHERDVVLGGPGWLGERLDEWSARGATHFADLRELAVALR